MAGITLERARKHLEIWLKAEEELATHQSYQIGSRTLTKASLGQVRQEIQFWENKVAALEKAPGRNNVMRVIPRDL